MCSVVTILVTEAEEILERLDQAERIVTTQRGRGMATIRVETFEFIGSQLVPRAIRLLRERVQVQVQVQVEVVEAEPTEAVELLRAGELNAGLIYDSADDPAFATPELDVTVLLEEPYQVLMARDSPFAVGSEVDLKALADADWICSRDESETSDRVLRRACHAVGIKPRVLMRTDDLSMIHGLVAEGLGCTLTTQAALDTRYAVEVRPAIQDLGLRRTSFAAKPRGTFAPSQWTPQRSRATQTNRLPRLEGSALPRRGSAPVGLTGALTGEAARSSRLRLASGQCRRERGRARRRTRRRSHSWRLPSRHP